VSRVSHHVHPLRTGPDRLVLVDGHPICATCGTAASPTRPGSLDGVDGGAGAWRHVAADAPYPPRWMVAITWNRLRRLGSYQQFADRFEWAVTSLTPTTTLDFETAFDRLSRYHGLLAASRPGRIDRPNPYRDLLRTLLPAGGPPGPGLARLLDLPNRRRELAARFAWSVPNERALELLGDLGPLVEGGAGTGYWAALLTARGADVMAYDVAPPDGPVRNRHHDRHRTWAEVAASATLPAVRRHPDRTLMVCWPPFDDDAAGYQPLRAYRGDLFAYVGDAAATGTARLHRELDLNWTPMEQVALPGWPDVRDRLTIFRRNPVRRWLTGRDRCDECRRYLPTGAVGRCGRCRERRPAALTLRHGDHRLEYPADALGLMPAALVAALRTSRHRVPY
jgi:hypothetical protein